MASPHVYALSPRQLFVNWTQPGAPNGVLQVYRLLVVPPSGSSYTLDLGLALSAQVPVSPYQTFHFILTVCTNAGCGLSGLVLFTSPSDRELEEEEEGLGVDWSVLYSTLNAPMYH